MIYVKLVDITPLKRKDSISSVSSKFKDIYQSSTDVLHKIQAMFRLGW